MAKLSTCYRCGAPSDKWGTAQFGDVAWRGIGYVPPTKFPIVTKPIGKRGPKTGTIARYLPGDLKLCPRIAKMTRTGQISVNAACETLAREGRIAGTGTDRSRVERLMKVYRDWGIGARFGGKTKSN
jgi:hypothetical protein